MTSQPFTLRDLPKHETIKMMAQRYPDVDTHALSTYLILARVTTDLLMHLDDYLTHHQMSRGRFTVLAILNRTPDQPLNPCELADKSGVTRATMTGLLDGLEREGLIAREAVPADRRMLQVRLTQAGHTFLSDIMPEYFRLIRQLLSGISDEDKIQLSEILGRLAMTLPEIPRSQNCSS